MLAATDVDVFTIANEIMQRYPKDKVPTLVLGLNEYFATNIGKHCIVIDSSINFDHIVPKPPYIIKNGEIIWSIVDKYVNLPKSSIISYRKVRSTLIEDLLDNAAKTNKKHALSAMLSNFTPAVRPSIKREVIKFLTSRRSQFVLPSEMQPKRGKALHHYAEATKLDFSALKADIMLERPATYEGRYWRAVILKDSGKVLPNKSTNRNS